MNDVLISIFGLRSLRPGDEGVRLDFAMPIPAWGWALIALGAGAVAWWCYWRASGSAAWRTALASLRAMTILLLALVLSGPRLSRQPERTERDWVVYLADRSDSMNVADVSDGVTRRTREEQLRRSLTSASPALSDLASRRSTMWLGFDGGAFDLADPSAASSASPSGSAGLAAWSSPTGSRTDLSRPIEQALSRVAARPVSGLVIFSDGRLGQPVARSVMQRLAGEQIPVFVVPLGASEAPADLSIARAEAPNQAFVDDTVPVNVRIERRVGESKGSMPTGKVQLVEEGTGIVLDEKPIPSSSGAGSDEMIVSLSARPTAAGRVTWRARIVTDEPDLSEENNSAAVTLDLTDRPIRVVYFDGYPRWEYRYMRGLLVRERSIRSSTLLLSASRRYLQEGSDELVSIPTSPGDWASIDVVVMGDVRAELFSDEQLRNLREHIARDGAGLLWVGGSSATPNAWQGTPLADLLPFVSAGSGFGSTDLVREVREPVTLTPTPLAARLGLLRLGEPGQADWPEFLSDPLTGWSRLWWTQQAPAERLKPTAEVLAIARAEGSSDGAGASWPVVMTMRYGAGRVLYVGTDEVWRWRYARGEALYERFWLPMVRMLARESLASSGKAAALEIAPDRAAVDQPVRVSLRILDDSISERLPARLTVRLTRRGASGDGRSSDLTLMPETTGEAGRATSFSTTWVPAEAGTYRIEAVDAALASAADSSSPAAEIEIQTPDDERRVPQADHTTLAQLAAATGGAVIPPEQISTLADRLPNRERRVTGPPEIETLWDRPITLILFMVLVTAEWLGRKWLRLA